MEDMAIGCAAFLVKAFCDLVDLQRIPYLKQVIGLAGSLAFGYCLLMALWQGATLPISTWLCFASWPLFISSPQAKD